MRGQAQVTAGRFQGGVIGVGTSVRRVALGLIHFTRRKPLGAAGMWVCLAVFLIAVFAPAVATHDPLAQTARERLQAPNAKYLFGSDEFGRDIFSRLAYGARVSMVVAFFAVGIGTTVGLAMGIVSGYYGGRIDNIIQRLVEIKLAFPSLILALLIIAVWGAGIEKVIVALAIGYFPGPTRIIRGTVLSVKENVYIEAARSIGVGQLRIMVRHILPNVMAPYLILASAGLGGAILAETSLSFLGLGVPPPASSWGRMLSGGAQTYGAVAPWMVLAPGIAITALVLAFNVFGDALRDVWDPRLRGT